MIKKIATLIIAELLILGQISPLIAANEVFNQTDWTGGADTITTAVHPTNETGWVKYYSKGAYLSSASAGKVIQISEPLTVIDTSDADFQRSGSVRQNVGVSNGSLVLDDTSEDPFVDNLGQWTSLPEIPRLDWWSAYVRMVHPTDGKVYIYTLFSGQTFGRFNTETETWEILADTLRPFGFGASLAYPPGSGDFIYATRGAGTKEFWKYSISGNTWTRIDKDTNFAIGAGGSITAYNANSIYCVAGNNTAKFMVYSISANTWTDLANVTNANVDRQGSLVYPGSGDYIYLNNYLGSTSITRYRVPAPAGWSTQASAPFGIADMCYPGTGNYLYAWRGDDRNRDFARLNFTLTTPAWENLTATARMPMYPYRGILYWPGSGTKLKWLSAGNYSLVFNFDTSTSKWDEPSGTAAYEIQHGADMVYDGTYIYTTRGANTKDFWRYNPATNVWEQRASAPFDIYHGGSLAILNGNIYTTRGYNATNFARYDGNNWTDLTSTQPFPTSVSYGGQLCAVGTYLYALRGRDSSSPTNKFYKYDPSIGWDDNSAEDTPATAGYGASLVYPGVADDQGNYFIYATRGESTKTFWKYCYDKQGGTYQNNTWYPIADAPFEVSNKGRLLYPGTGNYIYLFSGQNSLFARYKFKGNTNVDTWEMLEPTPFLQEYYYGACVVGNKIYANYYQDRTLYTYNLDTQQWSGRYLDTYSPYFGRVVYPGGDIVYMFYGNYTSHIWKYSISEKRWVGLVRAVYNGNPILLKPGTKACYPGTGNYIYMIEGGNSNRFWQFDFVSNPNTWAPLSGPLMQNGVTSITVTDGGSGYTGTPTVTITGIGTGAVATAVVTNYVVTRIYIRDCGAGYTSVPDITITGGSGFGATATAAVTSTVPVLFYRGSQLDGKGDVLYACQGRNVANEYDEQSYKFLTYTISTDTWQISRPLTDLVDLPNYIRDYLETGNRLLHVPSAGKVFWMGYEDTTLRIFDTVAKTWATASTPQFSVRARHGSCFYYHPADNSIYLFLGRDYYKFYKYSIDGDSWTELTTHGRELGYTSYDADSFYPATGGDYLYFCDGYYNYFTRYSLSANDWDLPAPVPYGYYYPVFCEGQDGDSLYFGSYTNFYRYNISTRTWTTLISPYSTSGLNWYWDNWDGKLVYFPGDGDSIFATRGRSASNFAKYSISGAIWSNCLNPGAFGNGHCLVSSLYKIYALMGGSTTSFVSYNPSTPSNPWVTETAFPATVSSGAAMVYIPSENTIYALRGNNTPSFYRYPISNPVWAQLEDAPVPLRGDPNGTSLVYPGVGDYIYMLVGPIYGSFGETSSLYRFSLSQLKWDTTESQSTPAGMRGSAKLVYPGKGNYLYAYRGYNYYDIFKYPLFKQGMYISEIKNIGRNKGFGAVTWSEAVTGNGSFEFKARTSNNQAMSGAVDWDSVPVLAKGGQLPDASPAVLNKQQYLQYRLKFLADDLNKIPIVNDLTLNYDKYRTMQELVSTPYDTTEVTNRLMKLSWAQTQPTGTDIRLQLKTASTLAGLSDVNNHFLGPEGTQTFNDNYSSDAAYAHATVVEIVDDTARLKKIYEDYLYTERVVLDNSAGVDSYTNNIFEINITSQNNDFWQYVKSDGSDIRFADNDGTALSYNLHAHGGSFDYASKTARIFLKVPLVPAGQKKTIFLKYGKADAESASDEDIGGVLMNGLVGYWKFDEGSGSTTADSSGQNNNGTLINGPSWVAGKSGSALQFNGTSHYVNVGSGASLKLTLPFTFSMWVKIPNNIDGNWRHLISCASWGGSPGYDTMMNSNQQLIMTVNGSECTSPRPSFNITKEVWHHIAYVVAPSVSRVYIDGVPRQSWTGSWSLSPSSYNTWIGYSPAGSYNYFWGTMDDVLIYNRALLENEIQSLYSSGATVYLPTYFALVGDKATSPSLSGWEYRHEIAVNNLQGGLLTDYQVKVNLTSDHEDFWSRCRNDGLDVRFVDSNNTTILSYNRVSFDYDNKTASFWVKVPSIPAGDNKRIYLYYGKSDAADVSSFNNTFTKDFGERGYNTSAVSFDGSASQKVTVNHSSTLNATSAVTLEANVKYIADTWLPGYGYRMKVTLDNTSGVARTNETVQFDVTYIADKMNVDFSDIKFADTDGTKLKYLTKSYTASTLAAFVVQVPFIPAASTKDIYMYYGNANAQSESDISLKTIPLNGLVGWWKFDDASGSIAADSSGNNNVGNLQGNPTWTTGKYNSALQFNGSTQYVTVNDSNSLDLGSGYTTAAWIYISSKQSRMVVLGKHYNEYEMILEGSATALNTFKSNGSGGYVSYQANYSFNAGAWYHVATVVDGTLMTHYVNGSSIGSSTLTYPGTVAGTNQLMIARRTPGNENYFNGIIDDVTIYNRMLSPTEIQSLYQGRDGYGWPLGTTFASEETQPAINQTIIRKTGAYELKFTEAGLTGFTNGVARVSTANYGAGEFTSMAFTYDGAKARIVVDGVEKASADLTGAITTNSNSVLIGESLKGSIDEVRIWNVARKAGDILENKEKCLNDTETGLRCYLRFNDNTGTSADDATTYNNNGTLAAGVTWLANPFSYSNGIPGALYHMDDGSGDATDSSGNANTITLHPDIYWSDTDLTGFSTDKSVNFGVNTYGSAADSNSLDITGKITLEAWIRPAENAGNRVILVKGDDTQNRWNYKLIQSNDSITFSIYSSGAERTNATPAFIISGNAYHVVATFDENTDVVKIYVNAVEKYSGTQAYNMVTNSDPLRLAKDLSVASASYRGLMDDVRIYRRILSAEEVKRHYEHRMFSQSDPGIYNVYAPPIAPEIGTYADNNPTIQPVMGVFYTNKNLMQFQEIATKPANTDIKYQVSRDGYWWFWYDVPPDSNEDGHTGWESVTGGYLQANTHTEIQDNLGTFQEMPGFDEGDFYYRAYLHSAPSSYKTPVLDNVAITLYNTETYYIDPVGATAINTLHTDTDSDRWFQYKAILYSDGEITPIFDNVNIEYIKANITVLTPNGGENLSVGDAYDITWNSQAITKTTGFVKLEYSVNSEPFITISEHVANTGTYPWTIPDAPSTDVVVRVSSEDYPALSDTSDASFSILSLVVNSPNGAEVWEQAKSHNITWTSTGVVPFNVLKIDYSQNNGSTWTTVNAVVPNNGSYSWVIPMVASDQAKVKVFSIHNGAITDTSDAVFSIVPSPAITITSPAGGETWVIGEKHNIVWTTNTRQFSSEVVLEYSNDEFNLDLHTIAQVSVGTPVGPNNNDDINGTYEWTIPDAVAAAIKVRVREATVPAGRDTQMAAFKTSVSFGIAEPSITVTAPITGNVFVAGDTHNITWTTVGAISNDLLLEYSLDGGTVYTQIATGEANDGTYSWTIPAVAFADEVYVRITDNQRTQIVGISQSFKVLEFPLVALTRPNGGEMLTIGTSYQIQWQTFGQKLDPGGSDYNKVSIYYSVDNGVSWTVIAYESANTGTYSWPVPDQESEQCLVKIIDEADTRVQAISADNFSIVLPVITVTYPNGGELWYATGRYNITWTSQGSISNNLLIEYSTDNGGTWGTVVSGATNSGSYEWASVVDANTAEAVIRITDGNRPVINDVSSGVFSIAHPTVTVTFPNGNEELAIGTMQEITWTSQGKEYGAIRDQLTLQYSIDGGTSWSTININQVNDGSYMWIVPEGLSNNCLMKIFDASRVATVDTSDAAFKIVLPYVRITVPNGNESWPIGTHQFITWTSVGTISDNLTLQYSKNNFATFVSIATDVDNTGSHEWIIPDDYCISAKIKLIDGDRTEIFDISDAAFIIAAPIIRVTAPNNAELWTAGDNEYITWENTGSVGASLRIEYSKDNFINPIPPEQIIAASAPNPNPSPDPGIVATSYKWTIPDDVCATVRVKITDVSTRPPGDPRPTVWDKSDVSFTILPRPEIYLDSPIGGEEWRVGSQHNITWHDNGGRISNNLTIQYCVDGGTIWKPVATGVANTGVYPWTIPDDMSASCLVKIFDANRTATVVESPDAFKIIQPLITITSPNGGEYWAGRDRAPITWTTEGTVSNNLSLEWSPNGGGDWTPIVTGRANTGSYTWTVPKEWASDNVLFRISDGDRTAVSDISDAVFHIIPLPRITINAPTNGNEFALGDTAHITWTSKGLSIPDNLLIELSDDGFASTPDMIEDGIPNNGDYLWNLVLTTKCSRTLKVRISGTTNWILDPQDPDDMQYEIKAISTGYFRVRGSLLLLFPNGNENWVAKSTQNITWQTKGDITSVRLAYSIDDGEHWIGIIANTQNENFYNWTLPDIKSSSVKVRVSQPDDDAATFDESDTAFNIVYATVTFKVLDYDTLQHLQDINFNEPASGWSDTGLQSPITRTEMYPYGTYTTFVTKSNYIDSSVTWNPAKSGTTPYVVTCYLENSASAQVTWEAILTYSFSPGNDTLSAVGSLQRKGKLIGTTPEEKADMGGATLTIYEPDGTTIRRLLTSVAPSASGTYVFTYADTNFASGTVYPGVLSITYRDRPYLTSANVDVGSEILQYEFFNNTATKLAASVATIEAAVAGGTAQTRADIESSRVKLVSDIAATEAAVKSHVTSVLATAETKLTAKVEETRALTEASMKSQILNTENLVKSGETLTIRYRTFSGLSPSIDVYNADNVLELGKGKMIEIGTTGIYEYDVPFSQGWGKGDFTIVCSETSKGVLDALTITVIKTNIEAVYNQVSAVLGSTAGISGLKQVADAMNSQFSILETALSKVGKDLLKDVKDASSSATALESVYNQLTTMAKSVKQITGETGMNLEKLYQVSADKKNDILYLKNKTQQMKAAVELTKQMTDNMANKPITQTWYEYKK